jgi:hypothetical protein
MTYRQIAERNLKNLCAQPKRNWTLVDKWLDFMCDHIVWGTIDHKADHK